MSHATIKAIGLWVLLAGVMLASASPAAAADRDTSKYALESVSVDLSSVQAGAHADFTTSFRLTSTGEVPNRPYASTRDIVVKLPPGLAGNPQAFPRCSLAQFGNLPSENVCPTDAQVGISEVTLAGKLNGTLTEPVYNMESPGGDIVARLGLFAGPFPVLVNVRLDPADNTLVAAIEGASGVAEVISADTTLWGVPAAAVHDELRLTPDEAIKGERPPGGRKSGQPEVPFLSNPTECSPGKQLSVTAISYQRPEAPSTMSGAFPALGGCGLLEFNPSVLAAPTTSQATTGSGLDYDLDFPTKGLEFPGLNAPSQLKRTEVILPEGMSVNPSQAEGLGVCSEAELARETYNSPPGAGCPESSKIGSVEAITPVIDRNPSGSLYVAKPYENRFGSLLALFMVLRIPDRGVLVKLAGRVSLDPTTGQITTVFDDIPQLPVASFKLHFREGARAPLITPPDCATHTVTSTFTPWAAPEKPLAKPSSFETLSGPNHGPCPAAGLPPFKPDLLAGTENNAAGAFSPFLVKLTRADSEQEFTNFSIKLPPGLAGRLAGIPACSDAAIAAATARTGPHGGAEELADPSCPAASRLGGTLAGAGVGGALTYVPGKIYLAGPYKGAPLSFVAITSGVAGPFDIGTVVVRLAIKVNPETGEVFLDSTGSDPIPHIIAGIPVHLRDVRAYVDRPSFTFNPTSCEETSTSATVLGSGLDFASPADDNPFVSTSRFQAADCAALPFEPKLTLKLNGQTRRAGNPALHAHLEMGGMGATGANEAGLAYSRVALPKTLFLDNAHIGTVCTRVQFKAGAIEGEKCPAASVIGSAKAITPILDAPLEGPIYLRSNPERELPDIAASLQGQKISVVAVGHTDSSKGGGLRNTFEVIPDAPIDSVDINLFGGKRGLIESSRNLCSYKPTAKVEFKGHNGKVKNYPRLRIKATGCGGKGKGKGNQRKVKDYPKLRIKATGTGGKGKGTIAPLAPWLRSFAGARRLSTLDRYGGSR